jgi:hypothetical protein
MAVLAVVQFKLLRLERERLGKGFLVEQEGHQALMVVVEAEALVLLGLTELPQVEVMVVQDWYLLFQEHQLNMLAVVGEVQVRLPDLEWLAVVMLVGKVA